MSASKTCSKCRVEKPLDDFHRNASKPDGRKSACKACLRDRNREYAHRWHAEHPEKAREKSRRWRVENPEKARETSRRRVASGRNAESLRRAAARYVARTPEQLAADRARLRPDGLKKCRSGHWLPFEAFSVSAAMPDGLQAKCRECSGSSYVDAAAPSIERRDSWLCAYCGAAPIAHGDHVEPKALGGLDVAENLVGACEACNLAKGARDLFDWRPDLFALVASWPCEERLLAA